jgi:hypothetical protein
MKKDVTSDKYKYSVPDSEIKIQAETSLWVAHLTQPVYTQSLFYLTAIVILSLLAATPLQVWVAGSVG